jgi:hypothetical protein
MRHPYDTPEGSRSPRPRQLGPTGQGIRWYSETVKQTITIAGSVHGVTDDLTDFGYAWFPSVKLGSQGGLVQRTSTRGCAWGFRRCADWVGEFEGWEGECS